jgi:hypothetical protein
MALTRFHRMKEKNRGISAASARQRSACVRELAQRVNQLSGSLNEEARLIGKRAFWKPEQRETHLQKYQSAGRVPGIGMSRPQMAANAQGASSAGIGTTLQDCV